MCVTHSGIRGLSQWRWIACVGMLLIAPLLGAAPRSESRAYLIAPATPGPSAAFAAAQVARTYAGVLCPADDQAGEYCVELSDVASEAIRHDARVRSIRALARPSLDAEVDPAAEVSTNAASGSSWTGEYQYDASGSIRSIGDATTGYDRYSYDAAGRLKTATIGHGSRTQSYQYDGFGNLNAITTDEQLRSIPVQRTNNRLPDAAAGQAVYATYDEAGNQTSENGSPLRTFDAFNSMTVGSNGDRYLYDASDERIAVIKPASAQWRWTIRDSAGRVLREFAESFPNGGTASWTWQKDYVYRGSALLGAYVNEGGATKRIHYHLDHLGTPRLITEATTGTAIARLEITDFPFGEEAPFNIGNTERRHFTGHERDYNSGTTIENTEYLDYMHARYYRPSMGRFLSVDPVLDIKRSIREPQSWNRYGYVVNNPINRIDPDGRMDGNGLGEPVEWRCSGCTRAEAMEQSNQIAKGTAIGAAVILSALVPDPSDLLVGTAAFALGRRLLIRVAAFGRGADDTMQFIFDAQRQKGNFGLGSMSLEKADKIGRAWVGDGAKPLMRDGKQIGLISEDGSKVYRFGAQKTKSGRDQANLEEVTTSATGKRTVVRNAHIDIEPK
jgi:RHS repeat-associated protein